MLPESAPLQVVAWIGTYLVHSTLLLALAWALTRRARLSLPAREGIWKLAVAGGFLTATLQVGLGLEPPLLHLALQREPSTAEVDSPPSAHETAALEREVDAPAASVVELEERVPAARPLLERVDRAERAHVERAAGPGAQVRAAPVLASEPVRSLDSSAIAAQESLQPEPEVATASLAPGEIPATLGALLAASLDLAAYFASEAVAAAEARPTHADAPSQESRAAEAEAASPLAAIVPAEWSRAALLAWSLAGLACALGLTLGMRRLRSDLRGRAELTRGPAFDELVRFALRAGLKRRVRLYVAPKLAAPLSMGWLRPAVCVPPRALVDLADDERQAMLAHEVAHLARRDPVWHLALSLCETACFFQPLNRLARRELDATFELAADAWAARATGERLALASCLARIAGWVAGGAGRSEHRAWSAALTEGVDPRRLRSRLGQRIERLLDEGSLAEPPRRPALELAVALASIAGLALFAPGAAAARTESQAAQPQPLTPPQPEPAQAPAPAPVRQPAPTAPTALSPTFAAAAEALERLDAQMESLESELAVLRAELGGAQIGPRLEALLGEVEARLERLGERRERIRSLLESAREAHAPDRP
jgi:Zn-dependent protease with chaperone function